jgi:hypothetical protein
MNPSIGVALSTLAGVYLAGIGVYLWRSWVIQAGREDLVINESDRTLELPRTFGRKQRQTLGRQTIRSLTVEQVVHRDNNGGISHTYAPTLWLHDAASGPQKLANWPDRRKAEEFAGWLRQQLSLRD